MRVVDLAGTPDAWTFRRFRRACGSLGVKPRHVLHVGGHLGQEVPHYRAAGVERITYMEPTPECAKALRALGPDVRVVEAAAGAVRGLAVLRACGGDGAWNTLRTSIGEGRGVHEPESEITVDVIPVRGVQAMTADVEEFAPDVLVVDTQGTEVEVLGSADLDGLQLVIVETQSSGHPEAAHLVDVNAHMAGRGWHPVLAWNHERPGRPHHTFADVFYVPDNPTP